MSDKILVDKEALRVVLQCLNSAQDHLILEQKAMREMDHRGINSELSAIGKLMKSFSDHQRDNA